MNKQYPQGTVRTLLETSLVTEPTRQALSERLVAPAHQPAFFSLGEFTLLQAVCARLIPQENNREIPMADGIDQRLANNESDGWRYDTMPADGEAYRLGLAGVQETARLLFQQAFELLSNAQQDEVLRQVQQGEAAGKPWNQLPARRFFEELLAEATTLYYSHPLAQEEIGYAGMADAPGWHRIGLNELEDREPRLVEPANGGRD